MKSTKWHRNSWRRYMTIPMPYKVLFHRTNYGNCNVQHWVELNWVAAAVLRRPRCVNIHILYSSNSAYSQVMAAYLEKIVIKTGKNSAANAVGSRSCSGIFCFAGICIACMVRQLQGRLMNKQSFVYVRLCIFCAGEWSQIVVLQFLVLAMGMRAAECVMHVRKSSPFHKPFKLPISWDSIVC